MSDVYSKVSKCEHAFVWTMHTHAWQNWLKHSRDWWRLCRQFNEPDGLHSHPQQSHAWPPGTRHQRAHTPDPSSLLSCLITTSTRHSLFIQLWFVQGLSVNVSMFRIFAQGLWWFAEAYFGQGICLSGLSAWLCVPWAGETAESLINLWVFQHWLWKKTKSKSYC